MKKKTKKKTKRKQFIGGTKVTRAKMEKQIGKPGPKWDRLEKKLEAEKDKPFPNAGTVPAEFVEPMPDLDTSLKGFAPPVAHSWVDLPSRPPESGRGKSILL